MAFGNQMAAKWGGLNQQELQTDWAESLQDFSLGAINHGIDASKELPFPPSQGEFKALCRAYKPELPPLICYTLTEEQKEINKARIAEIVKSLVRSKQA